MPRQTDNVRCAGGCGKLLWGGTTSLPDGQRTCRECRARTRMTKCAHCAEPFDRRGEPHQIYCSIACSAAARRTRNDATRTDGLGWNGGGGNSGWRRLRKNILDNNQRDNNGRCQLELPGCTGTATQVHHTQPWTGRPEDVDPATLMATCGPCNRRAGWTPTNTDPEPRPWTT